MSSFIGHSVAAVAVYIATESYNFPSSLSATNFTDYLQALFGKKDRLLWLLWLIIVASIPDLDYLVKAWRSSNHGGLRITHSILFSSIAPSLTIALFLIQKNRNRQLCFNALQLMVSGLSHLLLDLCVGVTPLPLLFPVVNSPYKLPVGILPSAGKIDLSNYYFYRNLKLEMGVLLPLLGLVVLWSSLSLVRLPYFRVKKVIALLISIPLLLCCAYFISLNLALPR